MKKILSVVLAVVMLFAVFVPAFAAGEETTAEETTAVETTASDQTIAKADVDAGNPSKEVQVYTKTTKDTGEDAYTYTVTIPADIQIGWGDTTAQDASYKVTSQLLLGAKLVVGVAANNGGNMTNPGTAKYLNFSLANGGNSTFAEVNNEAAPSAAPTVTVANFSGVPIAEYTGTLIYTVTYVAP